MSYQNELTPRELHNFRRRARFTACGEPADVFTEPAPRNDAVIFVTVNHNAKTGDSWLEATPIYSLDPTDEISAEYLHLCRKASEGDARCIIAHELHLWAQLPAGTVTGWTPAQIEAEAERIREGRE